MDKVNQLAEVANENALTEMARSFIALTPKLYGQLPKDTVQTGVNEGKVGTLDVITFAEDGPITISNGSLSITIGKAGEDWSKAYIEVKEGNQRRLATLGYELPQKYRNEQGLGDVNNSDLDTLKNMLEELTKKRSVKLGDIRILESRKPELAKRMLQAISLDDPRFQSQEFKDALKDTRRGIFKTIESFLDTL